MTYRNTVYAVLFLTFFSSPLTAFIDHFFDFHLDLKDLEVKESESWNDLDLTPSEWESYVRQNNEGPSRDRDSGGRDFTPDRDK